MWEIIIDKVLGYHDGYYWDFRIWFTCGKTKYTFIDEGSCSGYIPNYKAIARGHRELMAGEQMSEIREDEQSYVFDTIANLFRYLILLGDEDEIVIENEKGEDDG